MKEMFITSSVLIVALLLLRFLFRRTISRRVQYALWLLAALRLLIPANLSAIEHNVLSVAEPVSETIVSLAEQPVYRLPYAAYPVTASSREDLPDTHPGTVLIEGEESFGVVDSTSETVVFYHQRIQPAQILRIVWYVGIAIMALWFLTANLYFARRLRRTRIPLDSAESKYPVYLCDDIPSPCLFGLFCPAIYVTSSAAKDETRLRCVIAHEETHARHLDPLWSLVRSVCLAVWWFNPLVWLAAHWSKADCELACDEGTLGRLGESERISYGETLLALVPVRHGGNPMLAATTMTAGKRQMKERIQRIAEHKRPLAVALVAVLVLTGIVCAVTFTGAEPTPMTEEEALDALEASIEWWVDAQGDRYVAFTVPETYQHPERWNLLITGRAVYDDGMSMSQHYFEGEEYKAGNRYTIEIKNHTELTMLAMLLGQENELYEREINLLKPAMPGGYGSVEDYINSARSKLTSVTCYAADGSGEKSANVLDTRIVFLKKRGEVSDLAPNGTLELYRYRLEIKIDVPLEEIALAGGMYTTEDGWCDLEGQGGHALIALRRTDGSVDVLHDAPCNDDMGGIWHDQNSEDEALYDWAVQYYGLDLPPYSVDIPLGGENKVPANRVDGDGWYVYIPVRTWWHRADEGETVCWYSRYNTGSTISIREASHEEMTAEHPQLAAGQAERFVEAPDGRIWRIWTQYDPALLIRSDMTGLEPAVLDAMVESFTVVAESTAQKQTQSAASQVRALLDSLCDADGAGEPIALRLYSVHGDSAVELVGDEDARTSGNFRFYMNCLFRSVDVAIEPAELPALDENVIELTIQSTGDRLRFWEGENLLWMDRSGTEQSFRMVYAAGDTVAGDLMRDWYDEAEFCALGGNYRKQDELFIPDRSQTWLEAAQEFCERFEGIHLQATPGSKCKYTFVRSTVEAAEDETAHFREIGRIDENTWCFFLSTAFVPENERALHWSIAGNTGNYTGSDPGVPAGAYEYYRCGYAHRVSGGWYCEIVGTGW